MTIRLIEGDARTAIRELPDECADLVMLDPPYLTTSQAWDKTEVITEDFVDQMARILKRTGSLYLWCGIGEKSQSLIRWFPLFAASLRFKDLITWKKRRGIGMRRGWLYTREEIAWFVKSKEFLWNTEHQYSTEVNQFKVGMSGTVVQPFKRLTNVWTDIPEPLVSKVGHYAAKPPQAIERIVLAHTEPGMLVVDPFLGSGTTAVVCQHLDRDCIGIEIEPEYIALTRERLGVFG